ncbi:Endoglucanase A precursor [Minicystis rosea]|nr:Endoglucanase A precursor [Minicystis rosea]
MRRALLAAAQVTALVAGTSGARAQVKVTVDPSADAHVISPLIYGMNYPADAQITEGRITVGRWGGNGTSRYNYEIDTSNTGADYYFENIPGCWSGDANWCASPPADPKATSGANAFLKGLDQKGVVALFTVPTIGWVAKAPKYGHPFDCGCKGAGQDSYDPYDAACGNGKSGGQWIDCGTATSTSKAVDPAFVKTWVAYLVEKHGPAAGKRIYALDNEPALWSSTHHDIRKERLGFDELWQRIRDYAIAILDADPTAEIAGPAEWGFPNYFCSDADDISQGCSEKSPDRAAHGGAELMAWILDQAKAYEQQNGRRILHYLDLHYYPQGGNPPEITRSLWDPTYSDPSWIDEEIRLVPRMREWVSQHYPGTKLAVSEYDFYSHDQPVGAVTYAEVLGIFGREGLDMATAWSPPSPTDAAFAAYRLYRNYDGNGSAFEGVSVRTTVTGNGVQAYAGVSSTRMTLVLVNEAGTDTDVDVTFGNFEPSGSAQVFQHAGSGSEVKGLGDVAVQGGAAHLSLPATSITLLAVPGTNPNMLPDAGATTSASSGGGTGSGGAGTGGMGGGGTGSSGDTGGCGCRTASETGAGTAAMPLAVLALLTRRRRCRAEHARRG